MKYWMLVYIAVVLLGYLFIRFLLMKDEIRRMYKLLLDVSEDINEMKKKMGLAIYRRSEDQIDEAFWRNYIKDKVFEGKIRLQDLKKELGSKVFSEYKWWIEYCISKFYRAYPRTKRCPTCLTPYSEFFDECHNCHNKLVPLQDSYVEEMKEDGGLTT